MELNKIPMTAQIPSHFGVPACGRAFVTASDAFGTTSVVRERQAAIVTGDVKGDMGLRAYVPGTSAWRPPSS